MTHSFNVSHLVKWTIGSKVENFAVRACLRVVWGMFEYELKQHRVALHPLSSPNVGPPPNKLIQPQAEAHLALNVIYS